MTVATFGAGSVAGTIAISSAITLASKTAEVTALQIKKSKNDGDSSGEIFSDVVDSIFGNGGKIIGLTPLTKFGGFASGFYNQSHIFSQTWQLIKHDGFNLKNIVGTSWHSLGDRLKNVGQYMKMPTSKAGYVIAYGFAAVSVGNAITSALTNDPEKRAKKRKYKLY